MMTQYNKDNPFLATITTRYDLCSEGSEKNVYHIEIDITGSGLTYHVGDSIAIYPTNDPDDVKKILGLLHATGDEIIADKHGFNHLLRDFLTAKSNLISVSRKLIQEVATRQQNPQKQQRLQRLLEEGQKEAFKTFQHSHEVWDLLDENKEASITPQELCLLLQPQLPRFYSIASSMRVVGNAVHLTVAELLYETNGHPRRGTCTHYLCRLVPVDKAAVPVYMHPSSGFTLPEDDTLPIIMVGPGTGVAPFRGFMQERIARGATGEHWLFFGERYCKHQFFYQEYWKTLSEKGRLRLVTAFSRDQEQKVYVQHRLLEHGAELFGLLERGAYFYVCGDAQKMAKDVDAALHELIQRHGGLDAQAAKEYVKQLKAAKRYLRDVY